MAPDPTTAQVTMTLAALASTGATPRPSGETLEQQTKRIITGINAQLSDPTLATQDAWELVWLALSEANANMAYLVRSTNGSNEFAVIARGTDADLTDILEDLDVGTVVPFPESGSPTPIDVSKGAKDAFTRVVTARSIASPSPNATLAQALSVALKAAPSSPQPTVYLTGHSLGGCIATMLAPYLQAQTWPKQPKFAVMTFAAPTAGVQSFVDYFDSVPWVIDERQNNAYDLVPHAWADLDTTAGWYPSPGPQATEEVKLLIGAISKRTKGNVYVQPGTLCLMNTGYTSLAKNLVNKTTQDFLGQIAFQHANSTYLDLVGAPDVPSGPVVTDVSPTFGAAGATVTINGTGFSQDSMVDFGHFACTEPPTIDPSGLKITAKAPNGTGVVHVRVTNTLGTSPAVAMGQFAYGGPAPVVVSAVSPTSGKVGTLVTINGSGFAEGATVHFKDKASDSVKFVSTGQITATAPGQLDDHQTVNITVTVGKATSPTSPADEFTYTGR
ncbi:IPT/TIG domain-containing protein [Streptomyces sp. Je 1-4]|uniref:IPT/TIG domain-containing protein n=1 Tax=Streptomyces TaxID=1883 RepID=UPI00140F1257|nr:MULTISPECIES: IPT/TIG domain-containing protein [unclassified Streptomyces]QIK04812.1 lipase [Streptomyces sp. ID38640]UYB37958.1 IPT/TIG domain-containing protein [Streptomyces sp. Je 1-4]UZQ33887.1 IPT/TIG domain-containing protein [Streptomyces sp. Je 1-4] [Streptomyces sp. Je 1-4 4N24]UZQ41305.1 IPT/TIG domain-containing protein [Streptomyces sp. Je 1-4] [Streptomyces sp. Je 1-4 4N24_ara]